MGMGGPRASEFYGFYLSSLTEEKGEQIFSSSKKYPGGKNTAGFSIPLAICSARNCFGEGKDGMYQSLLLPAPANGFVVHPPLKFKYPFFPF